MPNVRPRFGRSHVRKAAVGTGTVLGRAVHRFMRHNGDSLGAAIAFQTLMALAPLLIVAVALLSFVMGAGNARTQMMNAVHRLLGDKAATTIADWLDTARVTGGAATLIGTILFLAGADRLVAELHVAVQIIFGSMMEPPPKPIAHHVRAAIIQRGIGIIMTLGGGLLIAIAVALHVTIGSFAPNGGSALVEAGQLLSSFAFLVLALAAIYRLLPPTHLGWRHVFLGALVTAALLAGTGWLLKVWFTYGNVGAGYGAAGSVVAILIWIRVSASVFVFGAEINAVLVHQRGLKSTTQAEAQPRDG